MALVQTSLMTECHAERLSLLLLILVVGQGGGGGPSFSLSSLPAVVQTHLVSDRWVGQTLPGFPPRKEFIKTEKEVGPPQSAQGPNLRGQRGGVTDLNLGQRQGCK